MSDKHDDPLAGIADDEKAAEAAAAWDPKLSTPVRKGGFPRWVWYGCGCGCFLMLLAAVTVAVGSWRLLKDADDPEVQWPKLEALLPFDERPADLQLEFGFDLIGFMQEFRLVDEEDGYRVIVRALGAAEQVSAMMDPELSAMGAVVGGERYEFELQGRTVTAMRFDDVEDEFPMAASESVPQVDLGPGVRVRLPRADGDVVVELRTPDGGDPVSDEQLDDFFSHFDLWR